MRSTQDNETFKTQPNDILVSLWICVEDYDVNKVVGVTI